MSEQPVPGRRHGVPAGRTEYVERMVRTFYPDGTCVDSEPVRKSATPTITWGTIAGVFAKTSEPNGTKHVAMTRNVVVEAGPWCEVPSPEQEPGA